MTGLAERLRSEAMQEGRQEGLQKGRKQGEQTLLRKQLVRRFGPLDAETDQRLQQATTDELERWAENLLDAESLAEVFGDG
jgi:predicted transposase YdaD